MIMSSQVFVVKVVVVVIKPSTYHGTNFLEEMRLRQFEMYLVF